MIIKGQKINDRYQIIRSIGEGGMANVYLAYDIILDRNVAVKILRGDLATDEKFVRRFQREAISASSLSHPNIVEMYDVGEDDGNYFIVMEYIDGKTLKSLIKKRGPLTIPEVIDIMIQLTSAIACAHDSYIIHRDIKPQNVMILDDGRVKITDFGIAIASNATELTQTNSVMGSVHYLPPEQASGQGATIKSDIYSLGILMFELLIGKVPFKGENAVEIALKQMKEPLPSVCKINPEIPQRIENIILKACAKNPKNRYDSCKEMNADLKKCLEPNLEDEKKVTYLYSEEDYDETKQLSDLKGLTREERQKKERKEKISKELDEIEEKEMNGSNKKKIAGTIGLISAILAICALIILVTVFIVSPLVSNGKDVKVPDVAGLTVEKAEEMLEKAGFKVATETVEKESDEVAEGLVISTNPKANRTIKQGSSIELVVSIGEIKIPIEDYKDMNYLEVKGSLTTLGLTVKVEKKDVEENSDKKYDSSKIIEQSIAAGERVAKGTEIILYVPNVLVKYPDFTKGFTLEQIMEWCEDNSVNLITEYTETETVPVGTIISQSREAESTVIANATLKVIIAKAPTKTEPDDKKDDTEDNN